MLQVLPGGPVRSPGDCCQEARVLANKMCWNDAGRAEPSSLERLHDHGPPGAGSSPQGCWRAPLSLPLKPAPALQQPPQLPQQLPPQPALQASAGCPQAAAPAGEAPLQGPALPALAQRLGLALERHLLAHLVRSLQLRALSPVLWSCHCWHLLLRSVRGRRHSQELQGAQRPTGIPGMPVPPLQLPAGSPCFAAGAWQAHAGCVAPCSAV